MTAENLLSRLDKPRRTGPDSWQARCPAHDDNNPSLTIRETDDGKVLVHCFAGCSVHEIVGAVGLELSDLFPPCQHHGKPVRRPFPATDALRAIGFEALVVTAAASALAQGNMVPASDYDRLIKAASRIQTALSAALPEFGRVRHG